MFTSVTAGNRNNIYFLDKWSGFLGQFNVIGLYNKRKWPQHPVLIPVKKFRLKISQSVRKERRWVVQMKNKTKKDAAVKSVCKHRECWGPSSWQWHKHGWKLPDKIIITVLNWKEKWIFFFRNVYVRETLYISPSSEKK